MTQLTDKNWAYSLPSGNYGEGLIIQVDGRHYLNLIDDNGEMLAGTKPLPPGTWRFLFTTKSVTEEQAASIVQIISNGRISGMPQYRRYDRDNELPARMWTRDARHSLETLLRSKGLDEKKNYSIIEKQNNG
jgi:hypothetical protein